jgi:type IV secretion system protein VirD4
MIAIPVGWKILAGTITAAFFGAVIMHQYLIAGLIAAVVLAAGAVALRSWWARYRSGGRLAARRRRKHQGWASRSDLRRARRAAVRLTRRVCPGAGLLELGTSRRSPVAVHRENSALYSGPPGYFKTAALACHAADAPDLLFCTSTKTGLLRHSLPYRTGNVWVLNADRYGGVPSTLSWSPVEGCEDTETAIRRARDLMAASPRDPSGKDAWHEDRGARLIWYMLRAAAAVGASMREVNAWVCDPRSRVPMVILESREPSWAAELTVLITEAGESLPGVIASAKAALGWMDNKVLADAACPLPGDGFSMAAFARSGDSVYMIGKKNSIAGYAAAFAAELFEQRKHYAEQCGGRPPAPATYVLDEMPLTCPGPLHDWLAEAREPLITIIMAIQALAQLKAKFGEHDGDTIRSSCPVEVFTGGEKRIEDLDAVSEVIGDHDTWQGAMDNVLPEPLLPPGALRMLAKGKAVILMPETRPVLAALPVIWKRPGHQPAGADHPALCPVPARRPAVNAAQRDAIALVLLYVGLLRAARRPARAIEAPRPALMPAASRDAGMYVVNGKAI